MKRALTFVVPALVAASAFQLCAAQTGPARVCSAEAKRWNDSYYGWPKPLPPILPPTATRSSAVIVRLQPLRRNDTLSTLKPEFVSKRCDYIVLTWWKWLGADAEQGPGNWTDTTISTPDNRSKDDPAPPVESWDHTNEWAPQFPATPASGRWARYYQVFALPDFAVITSSSYSYSTTNGPKPKTVAEKIGNDIVKLVKTRPLARR